MSDFILTGGEQKTTAKVVLIKIRLKPFLSLLDPCKVNVSDRFTTTMKHFESGFQSSKNNCSVIVMKTQNYRR